MVTFTSEPSYPVPSPPNTDAHSRLNYPSLIPALALLNMSKDDKASAAAAQLLIDDEPDDWCDPMAGSDRVSELTRGVGTRESSAPAAQVRGVLKRLKITQLTLYRREYQIDRLLLREEGLARVQAGGESLMLFFLVLLLALEAEILPKDINTQPVRTPS
jgi:hypothetical protein